METSYQQKFYQQTSKYSGTTAPTPMEECSSQYMLTSQKTELISVKLQLNRAKSIIISSFYRPPNMTEDTYSSAALEEQESERSFLNTWKFVGRTSADKMFPFSHISVPRMMSGSALSICT
jgi:hypothetical protein